MVDHIKRRPKEKPSKMPVISNPTTDFIKRLRDVCYWERLVLSKVVKLLLRETIKATEEAFNDADVAVARAGGEPRARPFVSFYV